VGIAVDLLPAKIKKWDNASIFAFQYTPKTGATLIIKNAKDMKTSTRKKLFYGI